MFNIPEIKLVISPQVSLGVGLYHHATLLEIYIPFVTIVFDFTVDEEEEEE